MGSKIGVIPARLHSTRFPKKILIDIDGKPMVIHTAEQASRAKNLDKVIIAIDNDETYEALKSYDCELIMTSTQHESGSDRIAEVISDIEDVDVVINIQADEPFIDPLLIDELVQVHSDPDIKMSTIISTQLTEAERTNESVVKAFLDNNGFAVDFKRDCESNYKHLGVYGFTKQALLQFVSFERTLNEKSRNLEQMRALDNGMKIKAIITDKDSLSINTVSDLKQIYLKR
jgi:3-deoxy-manno-octulosonate cytidylyltransferase (CMP-KDO synthetase)